MGVRLFQNEVHANIGGGRDNVIRDNVMYNAIAHSIQVDGRGLTGAHVPYLRGKLQVGPGGYLSLCLCLCVSLSLFLSVYLRGKLQVGGPHGS